MGSGTEIEEDGIIRAKWQMDDATTLKEAADKLRDFADVLDQLEADGWQLVQPVADDYGFIKREVCDVR